MPKKGTVLKTAFESFTVEKEVGGGGAGVVCAVVDQAGIRFAAKVLRPDLPKEKLKRFKNEIMFGVRETHPNLIKVLDFGTADSGEPFYIMPFAAATLRSLMTKGIEPDQRLKLFSEILDGVEAAHLKGTFHRDLKPENVLRINGEPLKVADFGIAHFEEDQLHTQVETLPSDRLANWEYAAPEQRRRNTTVDHRADIYALGLILTELFTGSVPHGLGGKKIAEVDPRVSYLDSVAESMRQQDPLLRPQSIREVKAQLIARENEFVEQQKLDRLRNTVVKESEITDPLISDPPHLVNVVYTGSGLEFELSRTVNSDWVYVFQNMPVGGLLGYGNHNHSFNGAKAFINARDNLAQQLIEQFKGYLQTANETYAQEVVKKKREAEQRARAKLASDIAEQERRAKVQSQLRW